MAPWLRFIIPLAFTALGLWNYLNWPGIAGLAAFIALFLIGSLLADTVFNRIATEDQIKQDLQARLDND